MTAVIHTRAPNRLGKLLASPGGITLSAALRGAQVNLDSVADTLLAAVDLSLADLRLAAQTAATAGGSPEGAERVYRIAADVAGLAGLCGQARIGEVAYSLCELTDRYISGKRWNLEAVAAHIDVIALLRAANFAEGSAEAAAILDGLQSLVRRAESPLALVSDRSQSVVS